MRSMLHNLPAVVPGFILACLWCTVKCATNLMGNGRQLQGEPFTLMCSTNTNNAVTYAEFYRSLTITYLGEFVGYREFHPDEPASCKQGDTLRNYTVSCNNDGSIFTLTIPAYNSIEHRTYWRCRTNTDNSVLDNNIINIFIIVKISGISWVSPLVGTDHSVNVTSDKQTTFQCQTTQGRPAANITWYLDNVPLSGGTKTTTPVSGDLVITTGYLTVTVNRTADGKLLSCRATNYVNTVESTVKLVIKVMYAPYGPPVIVGYDNRTVYTTRVGRPQYVTCQVPTAYPVPTLTWSCPAYTVTGTKPLPGSTDMVSSNITWTSNSTEAGQTCQCTSYQEVSGTVTTYINIDVLYPPSSPTYHRNISGVSTEVSGSIHLIQGDTVRLTCTTVSNPSPAIDQYKWTRSTGGSWTHGKKTLTIANIDRSSDDTYTCEVTNTITTTDGTSDTGRNTSQIEITVLYPPSSPTYQLHVSGVSTDVSGSIYVIQGDTVKLTCNTVSNPPPATYQYRWTRSTGGSWTHRLQALIRTHINLSAEAVYTCAVTNTMTPTVGGIRTGTNQSVIAVNVLYPPSIPKITYRCKTNPVSISVTHNTSYPVTCQSDGNPVPSVHWTGREQTTYNGTLSVYNIQNSGNYTCTVNNTMIRRPGHPSTVSNSSTIEIQLLYGPEVALINSQYIVEGSPLNVSCTAHSNPPVTSYYWSRPGSTTRDIEGPVLHIPYLLRYYAGVYTCHVSNLMLPTCEQHTITGTESSGMMVEVQYFPDIKGHTDIDVIEHNTSTVSCTADGVPATYTFYNWSHVAPDNVTVLRSLPGTYNSTTTTLTMSDVSYQDTGYYRCSVSNGIRHYITGETTATTDVMFTVKSEPITEPFEAATGRTNGSSTLTVKFYSDDGTFPTVTWRKSSKQTGSNITAIRFESSVNISNVTLTMYGHSITNQAGFIGRLTVHNITQEDFTNYSCQIANTIGSTIVVLALKPEGPPDPPRQLNTTLTDSSITLFWLSGFHGGADQTFTVEYRTSTEPEFKIAAVISGGQKEGVQFNTTIQELSPDTEYVIQITCSNRFAKQKEIRFVEARTAPAAPVTEPQTQTTKPSLGPIIGGAVGGVVGIAVVVGVVVGVVLLRRRLPGKTPPHRPNTDSNRTNVPVETVEGIPMETKTYENRTFVHAKGVRIHELYDYIMEHIANDAEGLKNEFFKLKNGLIADHKVGEMKQNKAKNRYKNMIAYDDSRVHLEDRDEQQTDYINACHILVGY